MASSSNPCWDSGVNLMLRPSGRDSLLFSPVGAAAPGVLCWAGAAAGPPSASIGAPFMNLYQEALMSSRQLLCCTQHSSAVSASAGRG